MTRGWDTLAATLAIARAEIAKAAPDAATAAEGEAYLTRVVTANLAEGFLGHLLTEGGLTRPLPVKGGPNPDYLLSHMAIDPTRHYRFEGHLNGSERMGVGTYAFDSKGAALMVSYATFDRGTVNADGSFALAAGPDVTGPNALQLTPQCRVLLVRTLHRDEATCPGRLTLSGPRPTPDLTFAAGDADAGLLRAGQMALAGIRQFLAWSAIGAERPNRFFSPPDTIAASAQGDPDTCYFLGYFCLNEGEWLEVVLPSGLDGYWSLHAYNHWCEPLPGAGIHDRNAVSRSDGVVHVGIGPTLPHGGANSIDTHGRRRGLLIFRAIGSATPLLPMATVKRIPGV